MKTFHRNAFEIFCILVHFVWREEEKKESEKRLFVHREISPQSLWYLLFLVYFASGFSFHLPTYPRQAIKATQTRSGRIHVQMDWKRQNISAFVCRLAVLFFFLLNANDMKLLRALTMVAFQSCARIFRIQLLYIFYMCSVIDDAWGIGIISYHSICLGHFNTESFSFPSHSRSTEFMRFFYFYRIVSVQE